ncbi:BOW99_gp33 family protein [Streptococcus urinalis]|uniref:Uncharacterized protein n=1 Tax=Streptococcus urinalis 2285-97 TaxID=764291 RepID=G5KER5_9STRE|nr:hypothetical protein [Streptococcus urinalis]EHJ55997.1 hypothetical protein STRUR_2124 [Streptococcus urinalis 2285-97]QBX22219.1 hypothetical protein Javan645_0007 [Streptococcus phage Javan645]QBX31558.1 hypothetical protein Javan640_0039 [Streptococcus phage Javan640]VEF32966.1 Uncharacterised protein [Streptococcus urinalis]
MKRKNKQWDPVIVVLNEKGEVVDPDELVIPMGHSFYNTLQIIQGAAS